MRLKSQKLIGRKYLGESDVATSILCLFQTSPSTELPKRSLQDAHFCKVHNSECEALFGIDSFSEIVFPTESLKLIFDDPAESGS